MRYNIGARIKDVTGCHFIVEILGYDIHRYNTNTICSNGSVYNIGDKRSWNLGKGDSGWRKLSGQEKE